jgi:hypothetical protein
MADIDDLDIEQDVIDYEKDKPKVEFKIIDEADLATWKVPEDASHWSYALLRRTVDGRVFLVELHTIDGKVGWCYADADFADKQAYLDFIKEEPEEFKSRQAWECYRSEIIEDFVKKLKEGR